MNITVEIVQKMLRAVLATKDEEIGCGECYERIEQFVELELSGKTAEEAMPLVKEHLQRCSECQEEYEALLAGLKEISD